MVSYTGRHSQQTLSNSSVVWLPTYSNMVSNSEVDIVSMHINLKTYNCSCRRDKEWGRTTLDKEVGSHKAGVGGPEGHGDVGRKDV